MSCCGYCASFDKTLHYVSPAHGGWGVIRVAALVPESWLLFVAPFACGRHGALGGIEAGIKDRVFYVFMDERDIVSGDYEALIPDAVGELFDTLGTRPKVLFVFVSCLDDLLGTDNEAIIERLSASYPDVAFRTCHMNPVSMDTPNPPGVTLLDTMYGLLQKPTVRTTDGRRIVMLAGNNAALNGDCELSSLLAEKGIRLRHIGECRSFAEFQELGGSALNLLLRPAAQKACRSLETRLGIPYLESWVTYDPDDVARWYRTLEEKLGTGPLGWESAYEEAQRAVAQTLLAVGSVPIAIDYQAVLLPFSLARMLLSHGFSVCHIAAKECPAIDAENKRWITEHHPDVQTLNALHPDMVRFALRGTDCICIGFDCSYMTGSTKTVNLMEDEGLFGFAGICTLMKKIRDAAVSETDLRTVIREAKLVI